MHSGAKGMSENNYEHDDIPYSLSMDSPMPSIRDFSPPIVNFSPISESENDSIQNYAVKIPHQHKLLHHQVHLLEIGIPSQKLYIIKTKILLQKITHQNKRFRPHFDQLAIFLMFQKV